MKLRIERLSSSEALADIEAEWESLDAQSFPRTPFTSPLWISLWWHHLRRRRLLLRDEFFCHIVRDADGRLVAVAPLMLTHIPGFGALGMRVVQFFGADPAITEIRGIICRLGDHTAVIQALVDHFRQRPDEWDVFRWDGFRHGASEYKSLISRGEFVANTELPDYLLILPDSWEKLQSSLSANMRRKLRIVYKYLEGDGHSFVFRVVERPEEVNAAIERFFTLHTARAEATDMINHPNKFATPCNRAFLIDYVYHMTKRGQLRIFELEIDGTIKASRVAFMFGSEIYLYYSGYDPSWKKYNIMTLLVSETIKWAIEQGLQLINLSPGNDLSKLRWKPSEIFFRAAVQISPTARGHFVFPAEALVRRSRRRFDGRLKTLIGDHRRAAWGRKAMPPIIALLAVFIAIPTLGDRVVFQGLSYFGQVCHETDSMATPLRRPTNTKEIEFEFDAESPCQPSNIELTKGETYLVTFEIQPGEEWADGANPADLSGLSWSKIDRWNRIAYCVVAPMYRRVATEPWFKPILRVGATGFSEIAAQPPTPFPQDSEKRKMTVRFRAPASGELFVFVNDAYPGIFPLALLTGKSKDNADRSWRHTYGNNRGKSVVNVKKAPTVED